MKRLNIIPESFLTFNISGVSIPEPSIWKIAFVSGIGSGFSNRM
jgi:hypothetical protein